MLRKLLLGLCLFGVIAANGHAQNDEVSAPEIIEKDALLLVGLAYYGNPDGGAFGKAWDRFIPLIRGIDNRTEDKGYGVQMFLPDYQESGQSLYLTAVAVDSLENMPIRLVGKRLPAARYAVFTVTGGSRNIGPTFRHVYNRWFPESGYRRVHPYHFELYDGDTVSLYIPVVAIED